MKLVVDQTGTKKQKPRGTVRPPKRLALYFEVGRTVGQKVLHPRRPSKQRCGREESGS